MKKNNRLIFIWYFLVIVSTLTSVYLLFNNYGTRYSLFFTLPLSYTIIIIVFNKFLSNQLFKYYSLFFVILMFFIRYVLGPLFFTLNGYNTSYVFADSSINNAIFTMIYEELAIFLLIFIIISKHSKKSDIKKETSISKIEINKNTYNKIIFVLFAVVVILGVLLILNPSAIKLYRFSFDFFTKDFTGFDSRNIIAQNSDSTIKKFAIVTFRYVFNIFRIIFPCLIATLLKYKQKSKKTIIFFTILSIIVVDIIIMNDAIASSVIDALIGLIYLSVLLNDESILYKALIISGYFVLFYFVSRFVINNKYTRINYINGVLQSYFSGVINVTTGFNIPKTGLIMRFKYFFYQILRGIPYSTTIFSLDLTDIAKDYNYYNGSVGQIIPTLTTSTYCFGILLSPILSLIISKIGIKSNLKLYKNDNVFKKIAYIIVSLYAIFGISMYSLEITCGGFFCKALPVYIIGLIGVSKNEKKEF